jgi:transaldolase/glucose-6-phosphate isomerase
LSDVLYVEELIGPDTVNTLPPATLEAFRDHGHPRASLDEGLEDARAVLAALEHVGISLTDVTDRLLEDGIRLFAEAFDSLLRTVEERRQSVFSSRPGR